MKILPYYIPIIGLFFAIDDSDPLSDSIAHFFGTAFVQAFSIIALIVGIASLTQLI